MVESRSAAETLPSTAVAGPAAVREPFGDRPGIAADPLRRLVEQARRPRRCPASRRDASRAPRRPARRRWPRGSRRAGLRRIQASKARPTAAGVREHVRVIPFGAGQDRELGVVRVEVPGVLVGLDHEGRLRSPIGRSPAGHRSGSTAAGRRRTPRGRRRPRSARGRASRRSCSCRAFRRRRRASGRRPRRRPACCHGSRGIPSDRAATSSGWSGSTAVSALVTASRSGGGVPVTCARGVLGGDRDAEAVERRGVRRRRPGIAGRDDRAGPGGQDRGRAGTRAGGTYDVDPLARPDWPRVTRARQAGADPFGGARHVAIGRRGQSARAPAPAPPARWSACCPSATRTRRSGAPRHRRRRRRPRRSGRPAWRRCRPPGRRSR